MAAFVRRTINKMSDRQINNLVIGLLLVLFAGAGAFSLIAYGKGNPVNHWQWADGFAQNFGTEMFGAFLTFLLFDRLIGGRQRKSEAAERQREANERRRQDQEYAIARLRQADALEDRQAILYEMQLRNLLRGTSLAFCDLSGVNLTFYDLSEANLFKADLRGADLSAVDLSYARLIEVKHITREQLRQVRSLEGALLPRDTKLPGRTIEELEEGRPPDYTWMIAIRGMVQDHPC